MTIIANGYTAFSQATDEEIFLPVPGYEGVYSISNYGRVKSSDRKIPYSRCGGIYSRYVPGRIMATFETRAGYLSVKLERGGKRYPYRINRLVLMVFIGDGSGLTSNHINGDKKDNRLCNLEWVSHSENVQHYWNVLGGTDKRSSKITDEQVRSLRSRRDLGEKISDLADSFGISTSQTQRIVTGQRRNIRTPAEESSHADQGR